MARNNAPKIELTAYDDLFETDQSREEAKLSKIRDIPISQISNSFNQVAHRVNKGGKLYNEDIADMKVRLEQIWQLLVSIRSTRERTIQLLISATRTIATCAYLLHKEHQNNSEISGSVSAQDVAEMKHST